MNIRNLVLATATFALTSTSHAARSDTMQAGETVMPPPAYIYMATGAPRAPHAKDCNDYAHINFTFLQARGLHPFYVAAYTERGEGHMVVGANIAGDTIIWDNRTIKPMYWRSLPYKWVSFSDDHYMWHAVKNK